MNDTEGSVWFTRIEGDLCIENKDPQSPRRRVLLTEERARSIVHRILKAPDLGNGHIDGGLKRLDYQDAQEQETFWSNVLNHFKEVILSELKGTAEDLELLVVLEKVQKTARTNVITQYGDGSFEERQARVENLEEAKRDDYWKKVLQECQNILLTHFQKTGRDRDQAIQKAIDSISAAEEKVLKSSDFGMGDIETGRGVLEYLDNKMRDDFWKKVLEIYLNRVKQELSDDAREKAIRTTTQNSQSIQIPISINNPEGSHLLETNGLAPEDSSILLPDPLERYCKDIVDLVRETQNQIKRLAAEPKKNDALSKEEVREAIRSGRIHTFFQPQINLMTGEIQGMEALVRIAKPGGGFIPPGLFIPTAESDHLLIDSLGEIVLKQACWQLAIWEKQAQEREEKLGWTMGINISPRQLKPELITTILGAIQETQVDPRQLELEILETALEGQSETTLIPFLENLISATGARLSMDDFGAGNSNFIRLKNFPLHVLKIDQEFIKQLIKQPQRNIPITRAMLGLAESFMLDVVVEGVETQGHVEYLAGMVKNLSIRQILLQGYLISAPIPAVNGPENRFNDYRDIAELLRTYSPGSLDAINRIRQGILPEIRQEGDPPILRLVHPTGRDLKK